MANMSYVRFENTLSDLQDCYENMDEEVSDSENKAKKRMIELCVDIACEYAYVIGKEVEEV